MEQGRHLAHLTPESAVRSYFVVDGGVFQGTILRCPINPASWSASRTATYADHAVPGRSEEVSHYIHGSQLAVDFDLELEAKSPLIYLARMGVEYKRKDGGLAVTATRDTEFVDGGKRLLQCYYFLDSLCLPRRIGPEADTSVGAPAFTFVWGDNIMLQCTMRSVGVEWSDFQPGSNTPVRGTVKVSMRGFNVGGLTHEQRLTSLDRDLLAKHVSVPLTVAPLAGIPGPARGTAIESSFDDPLNAPLVNTIMSIPQIARRWRR